MTSKFKRAVSAVAALAMAAALLASCGGSSSSGAGSAAASGSTAGAATNADRETVHIRFTQFGNNMDDVEGMENDPIKKAIEDAVNIELEYDTGSEGFVDRMQNELYTGGAAELLQTFGETDKLTSWVEEGLVTNLSEIVNAEPERYPTLYKIMNSDEYKMYNKLYTGDENAAYAIYSISAFAQPSYAGVPAYNTAILDEVNGGEVPATVEEFIAYTEACAQAGYVGWWPRNDKLTNWTEIDRTIASPQGTTIMPPKTDAWDGFVLSGELGADTEHWTLATTSEESKAVVEQLHQMYEAGALDSGIGVKGDFDDAYADFGAGRLASANFGFGYATQYKDFYNTAWAATNSDAQPDDLTLGTAPTSDGNYAQTYTTGTWVGYHYFIPTTCEYPDRVLDLVEFIASQEGQDLIFNTTDYAFRADQGADYWDPINAAYGYGDGRCKYTWFTCMFSGTEYQVNFTDNDWWTAVSNPTDWSSEWLSEQDKALVDYAQGVLDGFTDSCVTQLPAYYNMIALPTEASEIRTKLCDITNEYLTQMIGGQMDIENGWAEYQAEYERNGAAELETMVNEAIATARETYGS